MTGEYDDLDSLPSRLSYYYFDKFIGYTENNDEHGYWSFIEKWFPKYQSISSIYETLLNGFRYASYMKNSRFSYEERWDYLYFWMGEKIFHIIEDSSILSGVRGIYDSVRKKFDNSYHNTYEDSEITMENFKTLKLMYDYSQDYDTIENKIKTNNFQCNTKSKNYIKDGYTAYKQLKDTCPTSSEVYCKIFNSIKKIYIKKELSELICSEVTSPPMHANGERESSASESHSALEPVDGTLPHGTSHLPMAVTFPLLGILLILFISYKFTPIGSWFLHPKHKVKTSCENTNDGTHNFTLPTSEFEQGHFNEKKFNLSFYSVNDP
ncbi:PIR protein [Plasmodium ovale]|uniref:PIR protein n=1 Tax=Plasmodium ovale TaxID=36330 RepID=A0A1D3JCG5_PLAOA|nr:PIR protein [Plasmodium ovale]